MRAYLGLGSNLGDRMMYLRDAVRHIPDVVRTSRVYESDPAGGPSGQGPYLNLVVELETKLMPRQLLAVARGRELVAIRKRSEKWGPRTLDVDVLVVGELEVDEPDLKVPHPEIRRRPFVIVPLAELAPHLLPKDLVEWAKFQVTLVGDLA